MVLSMNHEVLGVSPVITQLFYLDEQAERRNTAEQRERADQAEERVIQTAIETYQEMGASKEDVLQKIQVKCNLSEAQANEKLALYWEDLRG